jgi:hypothetical protein
MANFKLVDNTLYDNTGRKIATAKGSEILDENNHRIATCDISKIYDEHSHCIASFDGTYLYDEHSKKIASINDIKEEIEGSDKADKDFIRLAGLWAVASRRG